MSDDAILVTGAAGFIGFHVARRLLQNGREVIGLDNVNDYYDPRLKEARLAELAKLPGFTCVKLDLAEQAGVRYSLVNPQAYVDANLQGFINVLEGCRQNACKHLLFASSSSVY